MTVRRFATRRSLDRKTLLELFDLFDLQIREISFSVRPRPECNRAVAFAQLQVIHDEAGLIGSVYIELCFCASNDNLDLGPSFLFDINIGLINSGILLPQAGPGKIWV